jgi:transposase-like protein
MTQQHRDPLYHRHRFPSEIIAHAVWLYFRFPLSLRMVEDLLAARGITVSHQAIRTWAEKFGRNFANRIRRRSGRFGDKWHLDGRWCMNAAEIVNGRNSFFDVGDYACFSWQRTEFEHARASMRLSTEQPMATSVC